MEEIIDSRNNYAVILAAGMGLRMGMDKTKQLLKLSSRSVLYHSVRAFEECADIDGIIVVVRREERELAMSELEGMTKLVRVVDGGEFRADSARRGVEAIPLESGIVAIHDAARPLITPEAISDIIAAARIYGAASAASAVTDTVKRVDERGFVVETLARSELMAAGTPQAFDLELYKRALGEVELGEDITDDNMLIESIGVRVKMVDIGKENIKITVKDDLDFAEYVLRKRGGDDV